MSNTMKGRACRKVRKNWIRCFEKQDKPHPTPSEISAWTVGFKTGYNCKEDEIKKRTK